MYIVFETIFDNEFKLLSHSDKKLVLSVMRKIQNNKGLHKNDYSNHLLVKGKYKNCFDCHPLEHNNDLVMIYRIKANRLTFIRINTHRALGLI